MSIIIPHIHSVCMQHVVSEDEVVVFLLFFFLSRYYEAIREEQNLIKMASSGEERRVGVVVSNVRELLRQEVCDEDKVGKVSCAL